MTLTPEAAVRASRSIPQRVISLVKQRVEYRRSTTSAFATNRSRTGRCSNTSSPNCAERSSPANPDAALRTSAIMNGALDAYYGGRRDAFWNQPARWQSLRNRASQRIDAAPPNPLTTEQVAFFETNGYLGPLKCGADWQRVVVPLKKGRNLHLTEPYVFDLCTHPSIVAPVAQLMRLAHVALFKSRFIVKIDGSNPEVAWHQDVGPTNGGYFPDGRPVPTVTCWLALDRVNAENGAVRVVPGTHKKLYGDYHKRIRADLVERGDISELELDRAVTFTLEPGEFYLFHSWLLHGSEANRSKGRRAGVNMRYAAVGDEYEEQFEYIPL